MILRVARLRRALHLVVLVTSVAALGACAATEKVDLGEIGVTTGSTAEPTSEISQPLEEAGLTTDSIAAPAAPPEPAKPVEEAKDDLTLGKEHYRARNYGLAEMHFRRATEVSRGNAEAWLGLAAAYDQLKRFELADRAYRQAFKLIGATPEFLNNRGYSYLLRGDLRRASQDLSAAAGKNPGNEQIQNNLKALDSRARRRA